MPVIEGSRVVLAVLELTDSTIHLLKAASHREISTKQLINALRWLVARERQTIRRQSKTIQGLQEKLEDMEMQLEVAQRQVQQRNQRSRGCGEGFKREEYVVDEKIQLPSLADLERFDMIPKYCDAASPTASPTPTSPPMAELQRCYTRMMEQYNIAQERQDNA